MNANKLLAAVAILSAAGSALADNSLPYTDFIGLDSTRTRAAVVAEIDPHAAGHSTANNEYRDFTTAGSTLTRGNVSAELESDFAQGRYAVTRNPEFIDTTQFASVRTRDQVRDENIQSAKSKGLVNKPNGS